MPIKERSKDHVLVNISATLHNLRMRVIPIHDCNMAFDSSSCQVGRLLPKRYKSPFYVCLFYYCILGF